MTVPPDGTLFTHTRSAWVGEWRDGRTWCHINTNGIPMGVMHVGDTAAHRWRVFGWMEDDRFHFVLPGTPEYDELWAKVVATQLAACLETGK